MINTTSTEAQRSLSALATVIFDLILLGENKDKVEIIVTRMLGPFNHIFFHLMPFYTSSPHLRGLGLKVALRFGVQEKLEFGESLTISEGASGLP